MELLFRETVSAFSGRLKDEYDIHKFDHVLNKATFYSESAINHINTTIANFKEKASINKSEALFREGLKEIGSAIWKGLIAVFNMMVKVAQNIKIFFIGGEKGYMKRLERITKKASSMDGDVGIGLPILKGDAGINGFKSFAKTAFAFITGDACVTPIISDNGIVLDWKDGVDTTLNPSSPMFHIGKLNTCLQRGDMDAAKNVITQLDSSKSSQTNLMNIYMIPAENYINIMYSKGETNSDLLSDEKRLVGVHKGLAKKGLYPQLMNFTVKGASKFDDIYSMKHVTVNGKELAKVAEYMSAIIKSTFAKSEKSKTEKGVVVANFERCMTGAVKSYKVLSKSLHKNAENVNIDTMTILQHINKLTANIMALIMKEYTDTVRQVKLKLNDILKVMEFSINRTKKSAITAIFAKAVAEDKAQRVYIMIKDHMLVRPENMCAEAEEMAYYAESKMEGFWKEHDGRPLETDKSKWNTDLLDREMVRIVGNFSKERFAFLQKLVQHYYASKGNDNKRNPVITVQYFKDSVKKKDAFAVRSIMADMISRQKGNVPVLEEAIAYAENKGVDVWETHDGREADTKWDSISEEYNYEKGRLVQNFSKVRFDRVIKLYRKK